MCRTQCSRKEPKLKESREIEKKNEICVENCRRWEEGTLEHLVERRAEPLRGILHAGDNVQKRHRNWKNGEK